uniref:Transmembrane protein n=1 Tax=Pithovirus LCPAC102 TaxID=2506587 RepID=A0A481Z3V3_9VIRU|nr:MAG: uncharacterized protein LCPAC102_00440 [Pithovirus LCPAC102]
MIFNIGIGIIIGLLISNISYNKLILLLIPILIGGTTYFYLFIDKIYKTILYVKELYNKYNMIIPYTDLIIKSNIEIIEDDTIDIVNDMATITYKRFNKTHKLFIKYDKLLAMNRSKKVIALYEKKIITNNEDDDISKNQEIIEISEKDITQQPGIPYFITANDINATSIEVRTRAGIVIKHFINDENIIL